MVSVQNLEFELQNLFKEKKFSKIIFEITTKTKENERTSGLFVLLGISRISLNKKNKDQVEQAVSDFKKGYLKEIPLNSSQSYYDTNVSHHHHFFDEEENKLIDIDQDDVDKINIRKKIPGKKIRSVEVIAKIVSDNQSQK